MFKNFFARLSKKKNSVKSSPDLNKKITINLLLEQSPELNDLTGLISLLKEKFTSYAGKPITYNTKLSDPFLSIKPPEVGKYNLDNILEWYNSKNPDYAIISSVNDNKGPEMPEFANLIACLSKDILLLMQTRKFPSKKDDNKSENSSGIFDIISDTYKPNPLKHIADKCYQYSFNLEKYNLTDSNISTLREFMSKINKLIIDGYTYNDFIYIMYNYLMIFSFGFLEEKDYEECAKAYEIEDFIERALKLRYIIYPTLKQLDYNMIIYFMQAPVINFRLSNKRNPIHSTYEAPIYELFHDVRIHGDVTHGYKKENTNTTYQRKLKSAQNLQHLGIVADPRKIHDKTIFTNAASVISKLKPFLKYTRPIDGATNNFSTDIDKRNFTISFILFEVLHEKGKFSQLEDIKNLLEILSNYKGKFYLYVYDDFKSYEKAAINFVLNLDSQSEITKDTINKLLEYVLNTLIKELGINLEESNNSNNSYSTSGSNYSSNYAGGYISNFQSNHKNKHTKIKKNTRKNKKSKKNI